MFNTIISISYLFALTLLSFIVFLILRFLFAKNKKLIFVYHMALFCILFTLAIGGGSVQNDGYYRLEKFIALENNGELTLAKKNPQNYDAMLQIDLQQFENSDEFKKYLKHHDANTDRAEAIFIGWLFAFIAEIAILIAQLINYIIKFIEHLLNKN